MFWSETLSKLYTLYSVTDNCALRQREACPEQSGVWVGVHDQKYAANPNMKSFFFMSSLNPNYAIMGIKLPLNEAPHVFGGLTTKCRNSAAGIWTNQLLERQRGQALIKRIHCFTQKQRQSERKCLSKYPKEFMVFVLKVSGCVRQMSRPVCVCVWGGHKTWSKHNVDSGP